MTPAPAQTRLAFDLAERTALAITSRDHEALGAIIAGADLEPPEVRHTYAFLLAMFSWGMQDLVTQLTGVPAGKLTADALAQLRTSVLGDGQDTTGA